MQPKALFSHITPEEIKRVFKEMKSGYSLGDKQLQLNKRQLYIAEAIKLHPEFEPYLSGEQAFLPESFPDPFLHLSLHVIVEELIEKNDPPEVSHFYTIQQTFGTSHHEIVHMLGAILTLQFWEVVKEIRYDYDLYRQMLREYASYSPQEFWQKLEEE